MADDVPAIIAVEDLPDNLRDIDVIDAMIAGANAAAARVAPCLVSADPPPTASQLAEAKLILLGAIKRWVDAGSGAIVQQVAGPFSQTIDNRRRSGWRLWPSEIDSLQAICRTTGKRAVFAIDTAPGSMPYHSPICALHFGANYCSCGADIAGEPIYAE